ncbi:MAG: hypothetical protein V7731_06415 [Amphritea sp.]
MMKLYKRQQYIRQQGIALVEVIIALFVMGFGLVALAMFSNGLFAESGQVKAKTEALQLAQQEIEQLREEAASSGLSTINGDGGSSITGVNASYTLVSTLAFVPDATDPEHATINVVVNWTDKQGNQSVSLNSFIAASDADALGGLVAGGLEGGGLVDSPDGSATYGEDGEVVSGDATPISGDNEIPEGTKLYEDGDVYKLTDEEGNVLLKNSSDNFSRVTGRVYIDVGYLDESVVQVIPSDTGVCRKTLKTETTTTTVDGEAVTVTTFPTDVREVNALDSSLLYTYFTYTCFFGSGWYGNIGIVRSDTAHTNDRSCGGDPEESDDGTDLSRHPQLMATRTFRGYTPQIDIATNQPLIDNNNNRIYLSGGTLSGATYGDTSRNTDTYDYLLTEITGTVTDSDCQPELALSGNTEFNNNTGIFVCLETTDGFNCPDTLPTDLGTAVAGEDYSISGSIGVGGSSTAVLADLSLTTSQGVACTITENDADNDLAWSCSIYVAGSQWSGDVALSLSGESMNICSVDSYNYQLDVVDNSVTAPAYAFRIADSDTCSGETQYSISGTVENMNQNTAIDLSGISVIGDANVTCSATLGTLSAASDNANIAEFSCYVPAGYTSSITLNGIPTGHRIAQDLDYSGSTVISDLTGQTIQVR